MFFSIARLKIKKSGSPLPTPGVENVNIQENSTNKSQDTLGGTSDGHT